MPRLLTICAIAACYFVFAILLNSVGTVILQSINSFDVSKPDASTLEGFKDLSIAFVSFFVASFIPRIGYKVSLLMGLLIVDNGLSDGTDVGKFLGDKTTVCLYWLIFRSGQSVSLFRSWSVNR